MTPVTWAGTVWPSVASCARAAGVTHHAVSAMLDRYGHLDYLLNAEECAAIYRRCVILGQPAVNIAVDLDLPMEIVSNAIARHRRRKRKK